jgi:hypothetical protein
VDRELEHGAVLRRADIDALELILRRNLAFDELADLVLDFAQLLGDVAAEVLVDLDNLQLGLGDLAFDLSSRGNELATLALEPGLLALELGEPGEVDEVALVELFDASSSRSIRLSSTVLEFCCAISPRVSSSNCSMR